MKNYSRAETIELVFSGTNYFQLLETIIEQCRTVLHLQTYIFETDTTGLRIIEALKHASKKGVKVYLLVDAFGSNSFSKKVSAELKACGIHFRKFSPLFSTENIYFGRRLHYKVVVADRRTALIGGINIADKYNESTKTDPWLDYAVLTKGSACEYLHGLCEKTFHKQKKNLLFNTESKTPVQNQEGSKLLRFRLNDFIKGSNEIHQGYKEALISATHNVTIIASYFLPGHGFRKLLANASARGVKIRIILAGQSDVYSVRLAGNYLYDFLLRNNIQLYEWTNSVLHGKAMLVDDQWATIGSYNLNFLSHYISVELNAEIRDKAFIRTFTDHLDNIINSSCNAVDLKNHARKINPFNKFLMWLAYIFFRTLMNLTVNRKRKRR
ncbi:MAG: phospholipase [Bacteroidetes bacterium]|nr:phospholipase [Bacteroidota bacterium]